MDQKFYFIYKTVNLINGKYYIGKHETSDISDGYLGSRLALVRSVKKYGKDSFEREIICFCKNSDELVAKEKVYVAEALRDPQCYNIAPGGQGGHVYSMLSECEKHKIYKKISNTLKEKGIRPPGNKCKGRPLSLSHKIKVGNALRGRKKPPRTKEHCFNISASLKANSDSKTEKEKINARIHLSEKMKQNHGNHRAYVSSLW